MQTKPHKRYILAAVVFLLMLLSFITGIFATKTFLKTNNVVPAVMIDVDAGEINNNNNENNSNTTSDNNSGYEINKPSNPKVEITDKNGNLKKGTSITLFKASYDNESGKTTVKSANGDKVVAPGTSNQYEFYINNIGDTGIFYMLESAAKLNFTVNGETKTVPLQVKLYTTDGKYLVGSQNSFADMAKLNGIKDNGSLSSDHYTKYILEWQWPYDGNDEFDTLIGNMSANGDDITVGVDFTITASEDANAYGGSPQTGDYSNIAIWMLVCVCSFVLFIILLFGCKREYEDEETAK